MKDLGDYIKEYEEEIEIVNELVENYEDDIYHSNNMDIDYYPYWEHESFLDNLVEN